MYCIYSVDTLDKGMTHIPQRMEEDRARFHHAIQNGVQLKPFCLLLQFPI